MKAQVSDTLSNNELESWQKTNSEFIYLIGDNGFCETLFITEAHSPIQVGRASCIGRIGGDEQWIIVRTYNANPDWHGYWILDKTTDHMDKEWKQVIQGPFSLQEFDQKKKDLGIAHLEFTKIITTKYDDYVHEK